MKKGRLKYNPQHISTHKFGSGPKINLDFIFFIFIYILFHIRSEPEREREKEKRDELSSDRLGFFSYF